jgi:hypothetical protein
MTKQGIHDLAKNTVHPSTGLLESPEAEKQDYHSTVAGKPFSIGVDFDKEVPVGKNNYHGEPLSYEHDNGDHKVVTTGKDGKKIGELLAKDSAPNTVEVVSNQVYDKDLRGKGRGVDQIQHLLEKVGDDIKSVKSDISTSKDARAAWDKLEKFAPEAVTKETFKDGQVQYSVDMEKWRGELGFREPHPTRTPVDEAVGFNPEQFHTQTDEPLTKLGEKRKRSPLGKIGQ